MRLSLLLLLVLAVAFIVSSSAEARLVQSAASSGSGGGSGETGESHEYPVSFFDISPTAAAGKFLLDDPKFAVNAAEAAERAADLEAASVPVQTLATKGNLADHGGRVVAGLKYYLIMMGPAASFASTTMSLYQTFLQGLGSSAYWAINTQYYRGAASASSYTGTYQDTAAWSTTTVTDSQIRSRLTGLFTGGKIVYDANTLYIIATPSNVAQKYSSTDAACSTYCGYHSGYSATISGSSKTVLYTVIPSAARCPSACSAQSSTPNANVEADAGISIIAHECEETSTDALGNAWYDASGYENADKCAWKFGPTSIATGTAKYNLTWGGKKWLVQLNYNNNNMLSSTYGPGCYSDLTHGPYTS